MTTRDLPTALERWAQVALEEAWVSRWAPGAIFPREMAFFLARCEVAGVVNVAESGRLDGYSTAILARYARWSGGLAHSIDFDTDADRALRARERLAGDPHLVLMKGNAIGYLGPVLLADRSSPMALLIDGPKGNIALAMLLGSAPFRWVRVGALHNLDRGSDVRARFERIAPAPRFHEEVAGGDRWRELGDEEVRALRDRQYGRSVDSSSLGVLDLGRIDRRRAVLTLSPAFATWQPLRFFVKWRLSNR